MSALRRDAPLQALSSFGLPARARELAVLERPETLPALLDADGPLLLLGGGSNTVFVDDFPGRIVLNRLRGVRFEDAGDDVVTVTAEAGEDWHSLVLRTLEAGLWGLENLALIPGSVGAAPMQNIGAYGVELSDVLESVEVFDRTEERTASLSTEQCALGYRSSRFRDADAGRFVILSVRMRLRRRARPVLDYPSLAAELGRRGHETIDDPRIVAAAVMRVRRHRLPDPARLPNAGSFFKNPVVARREADALVERFPDLPHWDLADGRAKLSAGWMIEACGWRGRRHGGLRVHEHHALVVTNPGGGTGSELLALAGAIRGSVAERFGVVLEPEPMLVGGALPPT
ncbi:MAG: UDP-N-acetylmuramate dehydrogenase [Wenzhouxiangellaceae bacterium]|nr:UDP-N-acetylmuramate dehydrogenase [Wenzhouxiangellaceae bacterium]